MQLTMSSGSSSLRSITARTSSSVASRMASESLRSTVVAPLSALSRTGPGILSTSIERGRAQPRDLGGAQPAVRAGSEAAEREPAEGDPLQRDDAVPERLAHAPHLALAPLADRQLERGLADAADLRRRGWAILEQDTTAQGIQRGIGDRGLDGDPIALWHAVTGMRKPVRELAVVREQDQPGCVGVQAPNRIQAPV